MKKWILPVLAITLFNLALSNPSYGWNPFKKDKGEEGAAQPVDVQAGSKPVRPATPPPQAHQAPPAVPKVQVRSPLSNEVDGLRVEDPVESSDLPPEKTYVTIDDPNNPLGITKSAQKLNDSARLIGDKKYKEAEAMLVPLKDWLIDATEAHISLHKTLKNVPSAQVQAELEKQLALQFALLRDKAFFQLGMLGIGQGDYSMAIKNLSKVIQSQPRSAMGAQAYEVLQQIGFTERVQLKETRKEVSQDSEE